MWRGAHSPGKMVALRRGAEVCGVGGGGREPAIRQRLTGHGAHRLGFKPWGYGGCSRGRCVDFIVLPPEQAGSMKERVRAYIDSLGLAGAEVDVARGHKIRFRRGNERIANERALLVGDSAGLADEFTEEGISYAVESGRLAARNVLRGLAGGAITATARC